MVRTTRLAFEQPMTLKPRIVGVIGIALRHILTPNGAALDLLRTLELEPRGPVRWAMPVVTRMFRAENERMLSALKGYAEANHGGV
jgi:hypothetical protein